MTRVPCSIWGLNDAQFPPRCALERLYPAPSAVSRDRTDLRGADARGRPPVAVRARRARPQSTARCRIAALSAAAPFLERARRGAEPDRRGKHTRVRAAAAGMPP